MQCMKRAASSPTNELKFTLHSALAEQKPVTDRRVPTKPCFETNSSFPVGLITQHRRPGAVSGGVGTTSGAASGHRHRSETIRRAGTRAGDVPALLRAFAASCILPYRPHTWPPGSAAPLASSSEPILHTGAVAPTVGSGGPAVGPRVGRFSSPRLLSARRGASLRRPRHRRPACVNVPVDKSSGLIRACSRPRRPTRARAGATRALRPHRRRRSGAGDQRRGTRQLCRALREQQRISNRRSSSLVSWRSTTHAAPAQTLLNTQHVPICRSQPPDSRAHVNDSRSRYIMASLCINDLPQYALFCYANSLCVISCKNRVHCSQLAALEELCLLLGITRVIC